MANIRYYLPGSATILIAILIVVVPEILVAFVAASIFMAGIGFLYVGHLIRKSETDIRNIGNSYLKNDRYNRQFARVPAFKIWYRKF